MQLRSEPKWQIVESLKDFGKLKSTYAIRTDLPN